MSNTHTYNFKPSGLWRETVIVVLRSVRTYVSKVVKKMRGEERLGATPEQSRSQANQSEAIKTSIKKNVWRIYCWCSYNRRKQGKTTVAYKYSKRVRQSAAWEWKSPLYFGGTIRNLVSPILGYFPWKFTTLRLSQLDITFIDKIPQESLKSSLWTGEYPMTSHHDLAKTFPGSFRWIGWTRGA